MGKNKIKYSQDEIDYLNDKRTAFIFKTMLDFQICRDDDLFRKRIDEAIIKDRYFEMDEADEEDKILYQKYKGYFIFNEIYKKYSEYGEFENKLQKYKGSDYDSYKSRIKPSCEVTSTRHIKLEIDELIKKFPEEHKQYLKIIKNLN